MSVQLNVGQYSDLGKVREENQDSYATFTIPESQIFVVADGMGGLQGGKIASELAVKVIREVLERHTESLPDKLEESMKEANARIYEQSQAGDSQYQRMGTTGVVLAINNEKAFIAHVGDSRIYQIRNGNIKRLTKDHSEVQYLLDQGALTEQEAAKHPNANVLIRALGTKPYVEVDFSRQPIEIQQGDRFLLCTDGLTGLAADNEILEIVLNTNDPQQACFNLVELANSRGGFDNITVQLINIDSNTPQNEYNKITTWPRIFYRRRKYQILGLLVIISLAAVLFLARQMNVFSEIKSSMLHSDSARTTVPETGPEIRDSLNADPISVAGDVDTALSGIEVIKEQDIVAQSVDNKASFQYTVQCGAFRDSLNAVKRLNMLKQAAFESYIYHSDDDKSQYYVRVGIFQSFSGARDQEKIIRQKLKTSETKIKQYVKPNE